MFGPNQSSYHYFLGKWSASILIAIRAALLQIQLTWQKFMEVATAMSKYNANMSLPQTNLLCNFGRKETKNLG